MRRAPRVKNLATRVPLRKAATSSSAAARRPFPAWIEAEDRAMAISLKVTPRVRCELVLRTVVKKKPAKSTTPHAASAR